MTGEKWSDERVREFLRVAPRLNDYLRRIVVEQRPILDGLDSRKHLFESTMHLEQEIKEVAEVAKQRARLRAPGQAR